MVCRGRSVSFPSWGAVFSGSFCKQSDLLWVWSTLGHLPTWDLPRVVEDRSLLIVLYNGTLQMSVSRWPDNIQSMTYIHARRKAVAIPWVTLRKCHVLEDCDNSLFWTFTWHLTFPLPSSPECGNLGCLLVPICCSLLSLLQWVAESGAPCFKKQLFLSTVFSVASIFVSVGV